MADIVLRLVKGSPLTNAELDANFSNLNTELGQKLVASLNLSDLTNASTARTNLGLGNVENKSSATIRSELTSSNVTTALGFTPYNATNPASYVDQAGARSAISVSGSLSYNSTTGVLSYTQPANVSAFSNDSGYITSSALSPYLLSATAASTYQTQSGMSAYLTTSAAASTYLPLSGGTMTGGLTLNGGTANGVAYLNGSKVLTTGSALTFDGTNFATIGSVTSAGASNSGNLNFTGTGNRITGDFSNATIANRVMFQTSTVNGITSVEAIPNGTSFGASLSASNSSSDPGNSSFASLGIPNANTDVRVQSGIRGTGTYLPMTFYTGGSERVRIDTSGNVGIGTSSPSAKLDVLTSDNNFGLKLRGSTGLIRVYPYYNFGGNNWGATIQATNLAESAYGPMAITATNLFLDANVGIGTSSPAGRLDVSGADDTNVHFRNATAQIRFRPYVPSYATSQIAAVNSAGTAYTPLAIGGSYTTLETNGLERLRIDSSGNVGIGTSSPTAPLDVNGNIAITGSARRITGDFSNATAANRVAFQTSTTNGNTTVGLLPNGTGNATALVTFNGSDPANANPMQIRATASEAGLFLGANGTASGIPMTFWNGGSERVRIDTSGNVGIGTSSPDSRLHVRTNSDSPALRVYQAKNDGGSTAVVDIIDDRSFAGVNSGAVARIRAWNTGDDTGSLIEAYTTSDGFSTTAPVLYAKLNGNVGIGTSSPSYKLQVNGGTASTSTFIGVTNTAATGPYGAGLLLVAGASSSYSMFAQSAAGDTYVTNTSAGNLIFGTNNTERARIDSSGNLQIGNNADAGNTLRYLDVYNANTGASAGAICRLITSNAAGNSLTTVDMVKYKSGAFIFNNNETNAAAYTAFGIGSSERMRIDSSGNLLVGTTSTINVSTSNVTGCQVANYGTLIASANGAVAGYFKRYTSTGDLVQFFYSTTFVGSISTNGSSTTYNTSSDYRLKNITGPVTNSGAYIDSLKPVEGTWKADGSTFVGLIAHEVQEVSRTQVATGEKDGAEMQAMDYSSAEIIANLIAEVQSLRKRLAAANIA